MTMNSKQETSIDHGESTATTATTSTSNPISASLPNTTLTLTVGHRVDRELLQESGMQVWIAKQDWESFCDCYDRLSLDPILQKASLLTRGSFVIAIICLVAVIVFGYLNNTDDDDGDEDDSGDSNISTVTILLVALPIVFPFVIAAWLNCRGAAMASRLKRHCRTSAQAWADRHNGIFKATVEALDAVSNTDEVTELLLIKFTPASLSSSLATIDYAATMNAKRPTKKPSVSSSLLPMARTQTEDMRDGSSCGNDNNV